MSMRYRLPACPATGSPSVEYHVARPAPGVAVVQRRAGSGPWEAVGDGDLRTLLAAPTGLAAWLREAMGPRPAHRPRRDPAAARVTICARVAAETQRRLAEHRRQTGEGLGTLIDRLVAAMPP
jgi:hypothetical protein